MLFRNYFFKFHSIALLLENKTRNLSLFLTQSLFLILLPEHVPCSSPSYEQFVSAPLSSSPAKHHLHLRQSCGRADASGSSREGETSSRCARAGQGCGTAREHSGGSTTTAPQNTDRGLLDFRACICEWNDAQLPRRAGVGHCFLFLWTQSCPWTLFRTVPLPQPLSQLNLSPASPKHLLRAWNVLSLAFAQSLDSKSQCLAPSQGGVFPRQPHPCTWEKVANSVLEMRDFTAAEAERCHCPSPAHGMLSASEN